MKKRQNYIYDIPNAYEQSREEALAYYDINTMYQEEYLVILWIAESLIFK